MKNPLMRKLTWLVGLIPDENSEYLHIFGAERVAPEEGDSFDIFHHRLFHLKNFTIVQGDTQKGTDLELDSPFVERSVKRLRSELGVILSPLTDYKYAEQDEEPEPNYPSGPVIQERDTNESDTVKSELPPRLGVVFFMDKEKEYFRLEVYRDGSKISEHGMKGIADYFRFNYFDTNREILFFTYSKGSYSGMAIAAVDMKSGVLLCDKFILPEEKELSGR